MRFQTLPCIPSRQLVPGFTIVECVISTVIVGIMLVAALHTVGAAKLGQLTLEENVQGQSLAQSLMTEILRMDYQDPEDASTTLGLDSGESAGDRTGFDDVDDYTDWTASPPQYEDGTEMSDLENWQREVLVEWIESENPVNAIATESGVKRITVTVSYNGRPIYTLTALRSAHAF